MNTKDNAAALRKNLLRSNTRLLLSSVMLLQFLCMLLVALRPDTINTQALILAVALPGVTWLVSMSITKIWPVDRAIVILALFVCSVGIITLQDICRSDITPRQQAIYACVGIVAMLAGIAVIRAIHSWKKLAPWLMGLCLLALLLPFALGDRSKNALNWISLGGLSAQPSEFMKPVLIVLLAAGLSNRPRFVRCLPTLGFAAACCAILLVQRDLGALLLYFLTTVAIFYIATSNLFITLSGLGMGCGAAVIAYQLFPYVRQRIVIWRDPWADPMGLGSGQLVQALIAIGSGGLFGMGLGEGTPRRIPLYHSDFVFASLTEEFGLIFAIGLLAVYVLIIMRGLTVAMNARTSFHSLTAFGIVTMLGLQTMLIVGGNTKLLPLTGVTLPLVAYGGSSLVSTFASIGILLGISSLNAEDETRDIEQLEFSEEAFEE